MDSKSDPKNIFFRIATIRFPGFNVGTVFESQIRDCPHCNPDFIPHEGLHGDAGSLFINNKSTVQFHPASVTLPRSEIPLPALAVKLRFSDRLTASNRMKMCRLTAENYRTDIEICTE